jgi:hypothetical protein
MKRAYSLTLAGALVLGAGVASKAHAGLSMNALNFNGLGLNGMVLNQRLVNGNAGSRARAEAIPTINEALRDLGKRPIAVSEKSPPKKK